MTDQREAMGTTVGLAQANQFEITGPIVVTYSATSFGGVPLVSYRDAQLTLDFRGGEITRVQTAQGELVTVILQDAVDAFVRTFTLVVPTVRLNRGEEVEFDTVEIETVDRSLAFVPAPGPRGVLQTYRVHQLHGVAKLVEFVA